MWCAGAQDVVDSFQLGIVEQGLQVCAGKLLCHCCQLLQVYISSQGDTSAQSLQDLHTSLLMRHKYFELNLIANICFESYQREFVLSVSKLSALVHI